MVEISKSNKINRLLFVCALALLWLSGPFGCVGAGGMGGGGLGSPFSPLNQNSGEKNGGEDPGLSGDIPDPNQGQNPGSPDQPKQDGIPIPPPPGGGGTIATHSPAQPYVAGAGTRWEGPSASSVAGTGCALYSYLLEGKIRPAPLSRAQCVPALTLQSITVLTPQADSQWLPHSNLQGEIDSCGAFKALVQFSCSLPASAIKLKVVYGYEGVSYELMSDEIILPNEPVLPPSPGNALSKAFIKEAKSATIG